jgi:hypothetical protein
MAVAGRPVVPPAPRIASPSVSFGSAGGSGCASGAQQPDVLPPVPKTRVGKPPRSQSERGSTPVLGSTLSWFSSEPATHAPG